MGLMILMAHGFKTLPSHRCTLSTSNMKGMSSFIGRIKEVRCAAGGRNHSALGSFRSLQNENQQRPTITPSAGEGWIDRKAVDNDAFCMSALEYQGPTAMPEALRLQATGSLQYGEDCH